MGLRALDSDLSEGRLTSLAEALLEREGVTFTSVYDLLSSFRAMSAVEFVRRVRRAGAGAARRNRHTDRRILERLQEGLEPRARIERRGYPWEPEES